MVIPKPTLTRVVGFFVLPFTVLSEPWLSVRCAALLTLIISDISLTYQTDESS